MSDEPKPDALTGPAAGKNLDSSRGAYNEWTDADKYSALAAFDMYGSNYYRTSRAYDVPVSTLRAWVKAREERGEGPSKLELQRRGSLAAKLEGKVHDVIESVTDKVIEKATLAQRGVFIGIGLSHLSNLRRKSEEDPRIALASLLKCSVKQLPASLELEPGDQIPEGFGPIIETTPNPDNPNSYEVEPEPSIGPLEHFDQPQNPHAPDCLGFTDINDALYKNCTCGSIKPDEPEDEGSIN